VLAAPPSEGAPAEPAGVAAAVSAPPSRRDPLMEID
jgi:hypothetical protein